MNGVTDMPSQAKWIVWVIPDRGGGWYAADSADTLEEAQEKAKNIPGDVTTRVLEQGVRPYE